MDIHSKYLNNIRYYPVYRFVLGMLIIGLTPYLRMKGLSYSQVMLLQSVSAAMVVLFEMPTGMVADKVSRKRSLFLSAVCIGVAFSLYILFGDFRVFVCAEMIFGIGLTFRSGADAALLYESLDRLGRKNEYAQIEGRANTFIFIGQGIGAVVSSLLYTYNADIPFWISVGNCLVAAGVALLFVETEREKGGSVIIRTSSTACVWRWGVRLFYGRCCWL